MEKIKIAMVAGHCLATAGKRIPKALDPNETREWVLNGRVCDKVEALLKGYTGYELLRIDDPTGKTNIKLKDRVRKANEWGADIWVEPHHNANKGTPWNGGGIVVYAHPKASAATFDLQKQMYDALIKHTGLKGNRSDPMAEANFYTLRNTRMEAVLLELGFMDSTVDAPIILAEAHADKCAAAIVEVLVKRGGLQKVALSKEASCQKATEGARSKDDRLEGTYEVTAKSGLNIRNGAGTEANEFGKHKDVLTAIDKGAKVRCWGYYTEVDGVKWLYVQAINGAATTIGFACEKYLKKV